MLDVIEQNVQRAYQITDDLLTLGRVEHAASTSDRDGRRDRRRARRVVRAIDPNARGSSQR